MKLAALYLFSVGILLAICLAVHLIDEFRGDGTRSDEGAGDGESLFHAATNSDGSKHDHA